MVGHTHNAVMDFFHFIQSKRNIDKKADRESLKKLPKVDNKK
jgi:hypothetical protein